MKKGYKLLFAAITIMLAFSHIKAQQVLVIDGINYSIGSDGIARVEVNSNAQGNIVIKDSVEAEGQKYAVKVIREKAFNKCVKLTGIQLPKGVNRIEADAFAGCTALVGIQLPDSLTDIGTRAFQNCKAVTEAVFPDTLKFIGELAFSGTSLTAVHIPAQVESIGNGAFSHCPTLVSISVDGGNTAFSSPAGSNAIVNVATSTLIAGCSTTVIPSGVKTIGSKAFLGCTSLKSIVIPDGVTVVASNSFQDCTGLTRVDIPASVTTLGASFIGCTSLNTMVIRTNGVLKAYSNTFENAAVHFIVFVNNKYVENYQTNEVWNAMTIVGFIPGDANKDLAVNVADIMEDVNYVQNTKTKSIDMNGADATGDNLINSADIDAIASLIKTNEYPAIKVQKASETENLSVSSVEIAPGETLKIPVMLTAAKAYTAFQFDVKLPEGLSLANTEAGELLGGQKVECVKIAEQVYRFIYYSATKQPLTANSGVLMQISLEKAAKLITTQSVNLTNIVFADADAKATVMADTNFDVEQPAIKPFIVKTAEGVELTFMPDGYGATTCKVGTGEQTAIDAATAGTLTIPEEAGGLKVTAIAPQAFMNCSALTAVVIPEGITSIGTKAFKGCSALTTTTLPLSVTNVSADAFEDCTSLVLNVMLEQTNLVRGDVKLGIIGAKQKEMESITIAKNVVYIAPHLTSGCTELTTITVDGANTVYDSRSGCNAIIEKATNTLVAGCKTTIIPEDVTAIGAWAFEGQTSFTTLTLHKNISAIGEGAYYGCTGITAVVLEMESPPYIFKNTFSDEVYNQATLTVQNALSRTRIMGTPWLSFKRIIVLDTEPIDTNNPVYLVTSEEPKRCQVGNGEEPALKSTTTGSITIPSQNEEGYQVTAIGDKAFLGCDKITSIQLPNNITSIGSEAFKGCSSLTSLTLPTSVTTIADDAFDDCPNLVISCTLSQMPLIKGNVKVSIYGITPTDIVSLTITRQVISLPAGLTSNCAKLTSLSVEEGNSVYSSPSSCNAIIQTATKTLVAGCQTTVIPQGVTKIASKAFEGQTGLLELSLPSSVTSIGEGAFVGCTGIVAIIINGNSAPTITNTVFSETTVKNAKLSLPNDQVRSKIAGTPWANFAHIEVREEEKPDETSIIIVTNLEANTCTIGDSKNSCIDNTIGGSFTIPAKIDNYKVVSIAPLAFQGCNKLTSVIIPEGVTTIGSKAFLNCTSLALISLPSTVRNIASDAFSGCTNLSVRASLQQSQYIRDDIKVVVTHTTQTNMSEVVITRQTVSLANRLLSNCASVKSIVVESGNTVFDSRNSCNAIINTSSNTLLFGCQSTVIPTNVKAIAAYAFEGHTGLKSVTLSTAITSIGEGAFSGCTGLTDITLKMSNPPSIKENTFSASTYSTAKLIVPEGVLSKLTGTTWAKFTNIVEDMTNSQIELTEALTKVEAELKELAGIEEQTFNMLNGDFNDFYMTYNEINETANTIISECSTVRYNISASGYKASEKETMYNELNDIQTSSESIARQAFEKLTESSDIKRTANQAITDYYSVVTKVRNAMKDAKKSSDLAEARQELSQMAKTLKNVTNQLEEMANLSGAEILKAANQGNRIRLDNLKTKVNQGPKPIKVGDKVTKGDYTYTVLSGYRLSISASNINIGPGCNMPYVIVYGENNYTITAIDANGFANCNSLEWVRLSDDITILHEGAFKGCINMTSIDLSQKLETIERYALAAPNLRSIVLPRANTNFVKIGDHLYSADESVLVRFLPIIGGEYTLPETLTDIVGGAFYGCTNLTCITINQKMPPSLTDEDAFDGLDFTKCKLSVPTGAGDLYRSAKGWNKFLIIEERHSEEDKAIVITANSYTREYGEENPSFEFTSEGAVLDGTPVVTCQAKVDDQPGVYPIIIQKGTVKNYNDTYINGTLTITKAKLKVSVKNAEREYGEPNPTFELVYDGWKLNDTPDKLMMKPRALCLANEESPAGDYTIAVSGGMDLCYDFEYTNGKLTVKESSGIDGLTVDDGREFDIYTTTGQIVKRKATSLKGLRPGIYIVGGKKISVK